MGGGLKKTKKRLYKKCIDAKDNITNRNYQEDDIPILVAAVVRVAF